MVHVLVRGVNRNTGAQVLKARSARSWRCCVDGHADSIAALHREIVLVVYGRLREPLVPGCNRTVTKSLDTSLQNCLVAVGTYFKFWLVTGEAIEGNMCKLESLPSMPTQPAAPALSLWPPKTGMTVSAVTLVQPLPSKTAPAQLLSVMKPVSGCTWARRGPPTGWSGPQSGRPKRRWQREWSRWQRSS